MSEQNSKHGKRGAGKPVSLRTRYKGWLAGLTRGQRLRFRLLQAAAVIALLVLLGVLFWQSWAKMPELPGPGQSGSSTDALGDASLDPNLPDVAQSGRKEGVYTFLVAGKDVASGGTDTILLLTYDTNEQAIYGLNLPRDTMINTTAAAKRINAVYGRNRGSSELPEKTRVDLGMEALKAEVAKHTGITPDFYVLVEWKAIGELVEALGGVEFEVPFDMDYDDPYQDLHIHQEAGLRVLNGDDAMQVIRHRKNNDGSHSNGDVGRMAIQQDFLKAVAKKCLQPATFLKVPELARIFTENVTTDLTVGNIVALAQSALGMDPETGVSFTTAPLADSFLYRQAALVTLDGDGVLEIVNNGMNPYLRDIQASDLKLVYRKSNGSFGVTNADLADPRMAQIPVVEPEEPVEEPEVPIQPEDPVEGSQDGDTSQEGDTSQGGDTSQSGDTSQGGDTSQSGDTSQGGDTSQSGDTSQGGDTSQSGDASQSASTSQEEPEPGLDISIDPEQVLPDPGESGPLSTGPLYPTDTPQAA